jgi:peptidoglycan/xylan/chitin deacetylase (PgdA/CDA1 family)
VLRQSARTSVTWSIEPDSWHDIASDPTRIVTYTLSRVHPGSIILLHVGYPSRATSRAAVGPLVDSLHARGYRVETVGALLEASRGSAP